MVAEARCVPQLPLVYSLTSDGDEIVPFVTNVRKRCCAADTIAETVKRIAVVAGVVFGHVVTFRGNLLSDRHLMTGGVLYLRQTVGRYLPSTVLGLQDHSILPACVIGDSTIYRLAFLIFVLALGPLNSTLMTPLFTSTLDT